MKGIYLLVVLCLTITAVRAETLEGRPTVIDGDSIVVDGKPIRLWGIDAPKMNTRSGFVAKRYLRTLIADNVVRCEDNGRRAVDRIVAQCFLGDVDIGRVMVLSGNARDWPRYSGGYYSR